MVTLEMVHWSGFRTAKEAEHLLTPHPAAMMLQPPLAVCHLLLTTLVCSLEMTQDVVEQMADCGEWCGGSRKIPCSPPCVCRILPVGTYGTCDRDDFN